MTTSLMDGTLNNGVITKRHEPPVATVSHYTDHIHNLINGQNDGLIAQYRFQLPAIVALQLAAAPHNDRNLNQIHGPESLFVRLLVWCLTAVSTQRLLALFLLLHS